MASVDYRRQAKVSGYPPALKYFSSLFVQVCTESCRRPFALPSLGWAAMSSATQGTSTTCESAVPPCPRPTGLPPLPPPPAHTAMHRHAQDDPGLWTHGKSNEDTGLSVQWIV